MTSRAPRIGSAPAATSGALRAPARAAAPKPRPRQPEGRPPVVVVGGGYGGLAAARHLTARGVPVVLVDPQQAHASITELHAFAATGARVHQPLAEIAQRNAFTHVRSRVVRLDPEDKTVTLADGRRLPYRALILATGAKSAGRVRESDGVHHLRTDEDARRLRAALTLLLSKSTPDKPVRVAVVGAGTTGLELATELAHAHPGRLRVQLVGRRIDLPSRADAAYAARALARLGIRFVQADAQTLSPKEVALAPRQGKGPQRLAADLVVSTAGQEGTAGPLDPVHADARGALQVDQTLSLPGCRDVYAVGDAASFQDPRTGERLAWTVRHAELQGEHAAKNVLRRLAGEAPKPFHVRFLGYIVSLGPNDGVGNVMGIPVRGRVAAFLKERVTASHRDMARGPGHHLPKYLGVGALPPVRPPR